MSLTVTVVLLGAALSLTGYAVWLVRRPYEPGKSPIIPGGALLFLGILISLLLAAHLITLLTGQPFLGRLR